MAATMSALAMATFCILMHWAAASRPESFPVLQVDDNAAEEAVFGNNTGGSLAQQQAEALSTNEEATSDGWFGWFWNFIDWIKGGFSSSEENAATEDEVGCFCINPYVYADLHSKNYGTGNEGEDEATTNAFEECVGNPGEDPNRCNEVCEEKGKFITFHETSQTLSFCGNTNGGLNGKVMCQCLDGHSTMNDENNKKIAAKRVRQKKIKDPNTLWMLDRKAMYSGGAKAYDNLKECYNKCTAECRKNHMFIAGCSTPRTK